MVDLFLQVVDAIVFLDYLLRGSGVAIDQGLDGSDQLPFDQAAHGDDLAGQIGQVFVEAAHRVLAGLDVGVEAFIAPQPNRPVM